MRSPGLLSFFLLSIAIPTIAANSPQQPFGVLSEDEREVKVERYDDDKVWRIDWSGMGDVNKRDVLEVIDLLDLDVWHSTKSAIDIRLNSKQLEILYDFIPSTNFKPFIEDLQYLVDLSLDEDQISPSEWHDGDDEGFEDTVGGDMDSLKKKKKKKGGNRKTKPREPIIDPFNLTTIDTSFHDKFHTLKEIQKFGDTLIKTFNDPSPNSNGTGIHIKEIFIGKSYEGNAIKAWSVKINPNHGNHTTPEPKPTPIPEPDPKIPEPEPKPLPPSNPDYPDHKSVKRDLDIENDNLDGVELEFIVQAGQHGREWVGPSSAMYFLHHLLLRASTEPHSDAAILLRSFRFTVIPQINPDGYAYSRDKSRMWRKNRQDVGGKGRCLGIDLNANWGYKWRSSRSTACSEGYGGKEAFEAYETKAVSEYLSSAAERGNRVRAFVDLHSYGQLFMFPFAHSCDDFPPDAEMLMEAGLGVAKAMRTKQGQGYEAGQACDLTYRAPGDAIDYTYGVTDVRWSYSAELRDTGTYGFMLPPKLIRPTADETTAGLMYLAKFIYALEVNPP